MRDCYNPVKCRVGVKFETLKSIGYEDNSCCYRLCSAFRRFEDLVDQILWSGGALAIFFFCCKAYERYFMTDDEKNERV